ncbi:SAM-dependent methyltransferase [Embleya hyalina]|uniref:S-adenosyl-L-methionine-dependent methyltransferase n=1 Tax=Embleya hyalina TaxID=516124 RepID=A0A401Z2U4_9ACTN|nr:SAM-dependent methyltransferase [Embleya hyalina]GCE01088.1 S-adenosyl-L-methionine-dependent methyltransferase [Embleya hyalina]
MKSVSATALWTAAVRAGESQREDALFVDELAEELAGEEGHALRARYERPGAANSLAIRTRYLDEVIAEHSGFRQVVFLAAGLDTRSVRTSWPAGTTLFEVDHADLLEWKEQRLAELDAKHGCDRRTVGVDLTEDWQRALLAAGWDPSVPTLWVAEGLLYYLPETAANDLVRAIADIAPIGSVFTGDIVSHQFLISEHDFPQHCLPLLAEDGSPWQFGSDQPESLLSAGGWEPTVIKCVGDEGASFGRWNGPPIPRHVPGIPRFFLFTATKVG